jgi:hypothetical protein
MQTAPDITGYRRHWAARFGTAPFLPMSRAEMEALGWDSCDVVIVTGDAYVDHPSFGMAIIGRVLESQGFRVGIIAQPDWHSADAFAALGRPNLFFGITAGNMDSMVNRYTAERRIRSDDAYTPGGGGGRRPDRSVIVYAQRAREAFREVPIVIGGIEASLRRIAHFDYWSEKLRRSVLLDAKADLLIYGNGASPGGWGGYRRHHRSAWHGVRAQRRARRMDRGRFDSPRCAGAFECTARSVRARRGGCAGTSGGRRAGISRGCGHGRRTAGRRHVHALPGGCRCAARRERGAFRAPREKCRPRAQRDPHARVRGGGGGSGVVCARVPHPASGVQPGQRPRAGAAPR